MDMLYERCRSLDIHTKLVVACGIVPGAVGLAHKELR